jgi:ectoine hydroxylase-related dioxygenase (phytanoyl-CoA dioxygenase family)
VDAVFFNARIIHGGSGNLSPERDLKVFNTQWLGDDVRVLFRPEGMDPDHSDVMKEMGLASGDPVSGELYPEVWSRGESEMALA